jgi:hypothetical protein
MLSLCVDAAYNRAKSVQTKTKPERGCGQQAAMPCRLYERSIGFVRSHLGTPAAAD